MTIFFFASFLSPVVSRRPHFYLCCLCLFADSGVQHFVLSYVFTFIVPCCDVRYDYRIKTMFGLSLYPVVCRGAYIISMLFRFVCVQWCPTRLDYLGNMASGNCLPFASPWVKMSHQMLYQRSLFHNLVLPQTHLSKTFVISYWNFYFDFDKRTKRMEKRIKERTVKRSQRHECLQYIHYIHTKYEIY